MLSPSCTRSKPFLKDDSGATAIQYGLIAAGISVAIIAVVDGLGTKLKSTFSSISTQLKQPAQPSLDVPPAVDIAAWG